MTFDVLRVKGMCEVLKTVNVVPNRLIVTNNPPNELLRVNTFNYFYEIRLL